jgi:hypothetical protein
VIDLRGTPITGANLPNYSVSNVRISQNTFYGNFSVWARKALITGNAFFQVGTAFVEAEITNTYSANVSNVPLATGTVGVTGIIAGENNNTIRTEAMALWFSQTGADATKDVFYTSFNDKTDCPLRDGNNPASEVAQKGMYGGGTPYTLSGMFKIPSVYDIVMDSEVGDQFDMTIKAKVH